MKAISSKRQAGYPHRISFNVGRNLRWPIEISDAPLLPGDERPYAIHVPDAYDRAGRLGTTSGHSQPLLGDPDAVTHGSIRAS